MAFRKKIIGFKISINSLNDIRMKTKTKLNHFRMMLLLALAMIVGQNVMADNVVGYPLTANAASTIGQTGTFSVSAGLTAPSFSGDGAASSGWDVGSQYWTISPFNTTGLHTITVGAMMTTDDAGPRDFQLQYKLSGGSWTDVGAAISLTGIQTTFNRTLPDECANVTGLEVRWLNTSTAPVEGVTVANDASSYIEAISILGSLPTRPNTQFTNITFTSITPTTIKLDGTIGNGDHRIIYIVKNTTEDVAPTFPGPADDAVFTANPDYSTGNPTGYQVIYNGTGSSVTVTVPNSSNEYWFRVYEYNLNGTMPRYYNPTGTNNPKLCALPVIVTDPATLIRLTTATIGATITSSKSTVTARGTQIKTGSSLGTSTTNKVASGTGIGSFTRNLSSQARGSRFYFRAYATNECGTIYADELYYENIPIFSGTGVWEDNTKWNVLQVPGSTGTGGYGSVEDSPIINGNCTLTASNNVTNLTIGGGKKLTINKAVEMKVDGTLVNNSGTPGILIKSADNKNDDSPNGTLIFGAGTPQATVEMFSKAEWNLSLAPRSKFKWQFFGIPVTALTYSNSFSGCYVREWDESVTDFYDVWVRRNNAASLQLSASSTLTAGLGYELVQENNKKYTFAGNLVRTNFSKTLPYTSTAYFKGQSILSNPYTAAMNISQLTFGANTVNAVYLYNTGTFNDWTVADGENVPGSGPGTYTVSTPGSVGLPGVPTQIPSMQAFLVKATANTGSVSYLYNNLMANAEMQRAKQVTSKTGMKIDLIGATYSDRMWILLDDNCTQAFDNGYDGPKMLGDESVSQLYGFGVDDIYQINAISDVNESYLGVKPGLDTQFKLVFNHQNIESKYAALYLIDLIDNKVVDITQDGTEYSFTSTSTDNEKRFKIVSTITNLEKPNGNSELLIYNSGNDIVVDNRSNQSGSLTVFDAMGRVVKTAEFGANKLFNLPANLSNGTYIIKAIVNSEKITKRIVIN